MHRENHFGRLPAWKGWIMDHTLKISVSKKLATGGIVSCRHISVRERFLRFLLGDKQRLTVIVLGDSVRELAISEVKVEQKVLGNLSQLIGIYLLQQNILATGNDARAENYLKENGEMQVLSSGGSILQNGGEAETEESEENEFLDFSFGG